MTNARTVQQELRKHINAEKAAFYPRFFKAFPGGYGEGDQFLGVVVPDQRKIAKKFRELSREQLSVLLNSKWHECRLTGLFILVHQYDQAKEPAQKAEIVDYYLDNLQQVNNWDLVDASAHKILGDYLVHNPRKRSILNKLSRQKHLWSQRVSVIATLPLIKLGQFDEILDLAHHFLSHEHDLMHKAVGWMLRELGKVNPNGLRGFLKRHASQMPRTMLRYAIERLDRAERDRWLNA